MAAGKVSNLIDEAIGLEAQYDWKGAVRTYERALSLASRDDLLHRTNILERIGFARYCRARQSDSQARFSEEMQEAISCFERTARILSDLRSPETGPRLFRAQAMVSLLSSWVTQEVSDKRRLLASSCKSALEAMNGFQRAGKHLEHWKTLSWLNLSTVLSIALEPVGDARRALANDGLEQSELAIKNLSNDPNPDKLASAYVSALFYIENLRDLTDPKEFDDYDKKSRDYWKNSVSLSERSALTSLADLGWPSLDFMRPDEAISLWKKALGYGEEMRDHRIIAEALDNLAYLIGGKGVLADNPYDGNLLFEESLKFAKESRSHYKLVQFRSYHPVGWVEGAEANYFMVAARYFATGREEKETLLKKGLELCPEYLRSAEETGFPEVIGYAHHVYGGTLDLLGRIQNSAGRRRLLLSQALNHREENKRIVDELWPFQLWSRGVAHIVTAEIRARLSEFALGEEKRKMLAEAVQESEEAASLCEKFAEIWDPRGSSPQYSTLGMIQDSLADQLLRLAELTGGGAHLRRAIEAYVKASEHYRKLGIWSRSAESHWKAASAYERLAEHLNSSTEFATASQNYQDASSHFPPLKSLYHDYSIYMKAWSEIQKARYHHVRAEYAKAREYYEETATLFRSSQRWHHLESNYLAWACLEGAEDRSNNGNSEDARSLFAEAWTLFKASQVALLREIARLEDEEKHLAEELAKTTNGRIDYCAARASLEEARGLDRTGNCVSASAKFRDAASIFRSLAKSAKLDADRSEMKLAEVLSRAWQMMTWGEAEASPGFFVKASRLFEEAKKLSLTETSKMLALGHFHFCRGLEAGTRFMSSVSGPHYERMQKHLENAANYYTRAGLQRPSEQAKATKLLFDASKYMHDANRQRNPKKKLKSYGLAERLLQASADSYSKADYRAKSEEVNRLLARVRAEAQLSLSLAEILRVPGIVSTRLYVQIPSATSERAVGVERFEDAIVQASILTPKKDLRMGEEFELRIELVNAGSKIARIMRIEDAVPDSLELRQNPTMYNAEGSALNPGGKKLDPLKTESVVLILKPTRQGRVRLMPRVIYLAESGKQLITSSDPVDLTVSIESGSKPEAVQVFRPQRKFLIETEESESVFVYLAAEFSRDYRERRLYIEKAGWRSLMDLVRDLSLPKRALYGDGAHRGRIVKELEDRGLIETRVFPDERGRGGKVRRVRVAYQNDIVKKYVDDQPTSRLGLI